MTLSVGAVTMASTVYVYPSVEAVTMATFPARLLYDIVVPPATELVRRRLVTALNITYE